MWGRNQTFDTCRQGSSRPEGPNVFLLQHSFAQEKPSFGGEAGITASCARFWTRAPSCSFSQSLGSVLVNTCHSHGTCGRSPPAAAHGSQVHAVSLPLNSGSLFSTANPRSPSSARVSPTWPLCACPHSPPGDPRHREAATPGASF